MFDLNIWHHALHQVTGAMALRWCRATAWDLQRWAAELRAVAAAMEAAADYQRSQTRHRTTRAAAGAGVQLLVERGGRAREKHVAQPGVDHCYNGAPPTPVSWAVASLGRNIFTLIS